MSDAYAVGTDYASRVGFTPTVNRVESITQLWRAIEECVNFPNLLNEPRESMIKQMACLEFYGPAPGPGVTYDMEGWRKEPPWPVAMKSASKCEHWGNVDPLTANQYLSGWVVQGSLDTSKQKAAYLVEGHLGSGNWWKDHIETTKAYACTLQSHPGPLVVPTDYLDEMLPDDGLPIGDTACNAVPASNGPGPPGATTLGTTYLAQGPAAPGGYWYAVSLIGWPPSTSVSVTCYDSESPGGFLTFTMKTDSEGKASSQSGCYSGEGPEHWVMADGNPSNRVDWGSAAPGPLPAPPTSNPARIDLYDNYGGGAVGRAMCRGNPGRPESMPGGVATETFTVPPDVASVDTALVQIDPDPTVTAHATLSVDGVAEASADAQASGDTTFTFPAVPVQAGDSLSLSISFSATDGKIITVYTVGGPGGTFAASNSCPDGAPSLTTGEGLRAVISGWTP